MEWQRGYKLISGGHLQYVLSPINVDSMGMKTNNNNKEDVLQEEDTKKDASCLKKPRTNRKRQKWSLKFTKGSCLRWLECKHIESKEFEEII